VIVAVFESKLETFCKIHEPDSRSGPSNNGDQVVGGSNREYDPRFGMKRGGVKK